MKLKILILSIYLLLFFPVFFVSAKAQTEQKTYQIRANVPIYDVNAVSIKLNTSDIKILGYDAPSDTSWLVIIPDCSNGQYNTETEICVTLGKTTPISQNELLGTIKYEVVGPNPSILDTDGFTYSNGQENYRVLGASDMSEEVIEEEPEEVQVTETVDEQKNDSSKLTTVGLVIAASLAVFAMGAIAVSASNKTRK